jgi:hypothetical protein
MNKLLSVLTLTATLSFTAQADEAIDTCTGLSALANKIMEMRQENISMADMHNVLKGNDVSIALLKEAYKKPAYSTVVNKQREIDAFKNDTFMVCIQTMGEKREVD